MKKFPIVVIIMLLSQSAMAQSGFFISPEYGAGSSNIHNVDLAAGNGEKTNTVFGYHAQISVGYQVNDLRFYTGLSYLRTGEEKDLGVAGSGTTIIPDKYYQYYTHVTLPVMVGLQIHAGRKINIVPAVGLELAYNIDELTKDNYVDHHEDAKQFSAQYNTISMAGAAKVDVEYKLGKKLSIIAGPEMLYMMSNMLRVPTGSPFTAKQNNYAYLFNAGIKWAFAKRVKKKDKPAEETTK